MKILTGNSNRPLAEAISAKLALPLVVVGHAKVKTYKQRQRFHFANQSLEQHLNFV